MNISREKPSFSLEGCHMNIEIITTQNAALMATGLGESTACNSILASTKSAGHQGRITLCNTIEDLEAVVLRKPDLVIFAVKYLLQEENKKIWFSEYFADHAINFSGSFMASMQFDEDKVLAKTQIKAKGISTANFFTAVPGEHRRENHLPIRFHMFLKTMNAGNSSRYRG